MTIKLTSPLLTELEGKATDLKTKIADCKATVQRLSRNQNSEPSVRRWTEDANGQEIGNPRKTGPIPSPYDEEDERVRAEILERTLAGEPVEFIDITAQLRLCHKQWRAYEEASENVTQAIYRERSVLAAAYCKELKPQHDAIMTRLCKALADVHPVHMELQKMRRDLIDSSIPLHGICLTTPDDFLGHPLNKFSEQGDFFRQAQKDGYIKSIPAVFAE